MSELFAGKGLREILEVAKDKQNKKHESASRFIIRKYQGLIHAIIKKNGYFMPGGEYDDLFSEGLFGLSKAIQDFDEEKGNAEDFVKKFENFLKICINRQLISAIKTSTRKKHTPLNEMTSFDRTLPENDNLSMMDILAARSDVQYQTDLDFLDPQEQLILLETHERYSEMLEETLSKKEREVYEQYKEDHSYKEMMEMLGVDNPKMIDNAIQRVRRKIEKIKSEEEIQTRKKEF